jgi:predicted nucleic acid-binding protein
VSVPAPVAVPVVFNVNVLVLAVGESPDWEDNRILDLAAAVGAFLMVSADADLTSMSPRRGRPVIEPPQFASMIDASRRARSRRH